VSVKKLPLLIAALAMARASGLAAEDYDLVLKNGRIVDGTGSPWYRGELAVRGDTIVAMAPRVAGSARRTVDVQGAVIAPGFIDLHTHARRGILTVPTADNYVRQGVTTLVEGPDGGSPVPLKPFLDDVAAARTSPNLASFIGQGSIREKVIGTVDRPATADERTRMRELVRQGMRDGAFGISTGLFYVPGVFTPTEEVIEMAKVAGEMGGIHISHMRDEAGKVADSVRETIAIGEKGGLPTQVTHHKIIGRPNWGRSLETLRLIDEARARGVDATIDQYPYTASSTGLQALLPAWALEGGGVKMRQRLADEETRARIKAKVAENIELDRGGGDPKNVQMARCSFDPALAGKNLAEITQAAGRPVSVETAADTALDLIEKGGCSAIFHAINEEDLGRILKHPATMIASDGEVTSFGKDSPHPRSYGTFARVLGRYARELKLLTLEEAVRKMSAMPAARIGLVDRGLLRPGMKADLAVFDPERVADAATFEQPHQYAVGVDLVVVNGQVVFENGTMTAARPGRVLLGPAATLTAPSGAFAQRRTKSETMSSLPCIPSSTPLPASPSSAARRCPRSWSSARPNSATTRSPSSIVTVSPARRGSSRPRARPASVLSSAPS
jgi:N-acyl-D-amino-acid deacylase